MKDTAKRVRAVFFPTEDEGEPVMEWLKAMPKVRPSAGRYGHQDGGVRLAIGMPTCRPLGQEKCGRYMWTEAT